MEVMMIVMVIMIMAVMMMVMMTMIMLVKTIIVTVSTSVLKKTKQPPKVWLCHHSSSHPCPCPFCQLCPLQLFNLSKYGFQKCGFVTILLPILVLPLVNCSALFNFNFNFNFFPSLSSFFLSTAVPSSTSHFSQKVFSSRVLEFPEEKLNNQNAMTLSGIGA